MQSLLRRQVPGWVGLVGAAGMLVSVLMLSGCPGTLDPAVLAGSTGTGGSSSNCTGDNAGATIVTKNCAISGCHDSSGAVFAGDLDLTVDSTIGSRLVGVMAAQPTATNLAACMDETVPLLVAGSTPATGLLIDKINPNPPCGLAMPYPGLILLPAAQRTCLIEWATTLTSP